MALIPCKGAKFYRAGTEIANVVSVSPPSVTLGEWDGTALSSDNVMAYPTLPDPGEMSIMLNLDLAISTHVALFEDIADGTVETMAIEFNSEATNKYLQFEGWIKSIAPDTHTPTNYAQATMTVRLQSIPVWAASAGS